MARVGYPVTRCNLLDSVQQLVKRSGRPNPFTDGRQGKKWYYGFIKRNYGLSFKVKCDELSKKPEEEIQIKRSNVKKDINISNISDKSICQVKQELMKKASF